MYCETEEVRALAQGMSVDEFGETELEALIIRASRIFDLACGVPAEHFEAADDEPSSRTFWGNGTNFLRLDPYVPGSLNTTLTYPDGYSTLGFVERDGYLVRSENGILVSVAWSGWYQNVPIVVSARWGYDETPEDVKSAIIEFVINIWRETDPAFLKLVSIDNQPLRERMPPRVADVARRRRAQVGVVV
jgi:hypothetical protein